MPAYAFARLLMRYPKPGHRRLPTTIFCEDRGPADQRYEGQATLAQFIPNVAHDSASAKKHPPSIGQCPLSLAVTSRHLLTLSSSQFDPADIHRFCYGIRQSNPKATPRNRRGYSRHAPQTESTDPSNAPKYGRANIRGPRARGTYFFRAALTSLSSWMDHYMRHPVDNRKLHGMPAVPAASDGCGRLTADAANKPAPIAALARVLINGLKLNRRERRRCNVVHSLITRIYPWRCTGFSSRWPSRLHLWLLQ
jgi:hypothetical protein